MVRVRDKWEAAGPNGLVMGRNGRKFLEEIQTPGYVYDCGVGKMIFCPMTTSSNNHFFVLIKTQQYLHTG
jgi:hypothetical protein